MRLFLLFLTIVICQAFSPLQENPKGTLLLQVEGIKEIKGNLGILVFNKSDGFPDQAEKAIISKEVTVTASSMLLEFNDLPFGEYAIAMIHDVNSNQAFDKNIIGIPKEPYGFSNNKSILSGLPKFEEARVQLQKNEYKTTIRLVSLW